MRRGAAAMSRRAARWGQQVVEAVYSEAGRDVHLDERCYEHAARSFDETGRLVGGWRKADELHFTTLDGASPLGGRCDRRPRRRSPAAGVSVSPVPGNPDKASPGDGGPGPGAPRQHHHLRAGLSIPDAISQLENWAIRCRRPRGSP